MATTPTDHPLVAAYLRDLEMLLHGLPPTERGEVLLGVRDHFEEALGTDPSDADVRAAIAELGPAVNIADEAYASDTGRRSSSGPSAGRAWRVSRAAVWTVAALTGVSLLVLSALSVGPGVFFWPMTLGAAFFPVGPLWVVATAVLFGATQWTAGERRLLVALLPATVVALTLLGMVGPALPDLLLMVLALGVLLSTWAGFVVLVRRGLSRAA